MSTRATYRFKRSPSTPEYLVTDVTFYIHHDGYPTGAYEYFKKMSEYQCDAPNASAADKFIKANDRAEITRGHEYHDDTDYQYTLECVEEREYGHLNNKLTVMSGDEEIYSGLLKDFLDLKGEIEDNEED